MSGRLRGLRDVRTLAGAGGIAARPRERHVLLFKIGCLELERSRRLKEKEAALDRIRGIDARICVIDAEIRGHHENLGYGDSLSAARNAVAVENDSPGSGRPRRTIRYGG